MHATSSQSLPLIFISILSTAICWGIYGPLLQWGHLEMGSGRLRPFICVGVAYLVIAIVGPIVVMMLTGMEQGDGLASGWTMKGVWWSFIAGTAGALGALGMILAFNFGGKPHYVPPLIFGLAPVVNTFFALAVNPALRNQLKENPFYSSCYGAGLMMVAVGAVVVLVSASFLQAKAAPKPATAAIPAEIQRDVAEEPAPNIVSQPIDSAEKSS